MNVLFFSHSSQLGGAERSLLELVNQLTNNHNFICTAVLPSDGPLKKLLELYGAATVVVDYKWWCESKKLSADETAQRLIESNTNFIGVVGELSQINPDVVVTNTMVIPWGAISAAWLDKPHIWFAREFGEKDHGLVFGLTFAKTVQLIQDSSNHLLVNSDAVGKHLFGSCNTKPIQTIYPPVNVPENAIRKPDSNIYSR